MGGKKIKILPSYRIKFVKYVTAMYREGDMILRRASDSLHKHTNQKE
jgi:hypothetical protein